MKNKNLLIHKDEILIDEQKFETCIITQQSSNKKETLETYKIINMS